MRLRTLSSEGMEGPFFTPDLSCVCVLGMINWTRFSSTRSSYFFLLTIEFFSAILPASAASSESCPRVALSFNDSTAPSVLVCGWRLDLQPAVLSNLGPVVFVLIALIPCSIFYFLATSTLLTLLEAGPIGTYVPKVTYPHF
jgi:hypothetical protein